MSRLLLLHNLVVNDERLEEDKVTDKFTCKLHTSQHATVASSDDTFLAVAKQVSCFHLGVFQPTFIIYFEVQHVTVLTIYSCI